MKRTYLAAVVALIVLGVVVDWRLSGAADLETPVSALSASRDDEVAKLTVRVEALERRLAALEDSRTLVRQADSRTIESVPQPMPLPKTFVPNDPGDQMTNKQTWRIRFLGNNTKEVPIRQ